MSSWIFQANPNTFKIDDFLDTRPEIFTWLVPRYADQIQPGDRVFLWRAVAGESAKAGVIAQATVASPVSKMLSDQLSKKFWTDSSQATIKADRVKLKLIRRGSSREILKREWLKDDPVLGNMLILKQPAGTVFPLDKTEAQRITRMWSLVGKDWTREESLAGLWAYARTFGGPVSQLADSPVGLVSLNIGRAVSGVYNKVMNFRSIDPRDPRAGMSGASDVDRLVWAEFFDTKKQKLRIDKLHSEFVDICSKTMPKNGIWPLPPQFWDVSESKMEGGEFNIDDIVSALSTISINEGQKKMLIGHYNAPGRRLSVHKLGLLAGYEGGNSGRLHYGKLARNLALELGHENENDRIALLAEWNAEDKDENGHGQWRLRNSFAGALEELKWVVPVADKEIDDNTVLRNLEKDQEFLALPATTREAIVSARVGQGIFRERLMSYWEGCAVTGCSFGDVLVASHIVPWKLASNQARLDPFNGLLLTANLDKMFDRLLVSFDEKGRIVLSKSVDSKVYKTLGIDLNMKLRKLESEHLFYLSVHLAEFHAREAR